MSGPIIDIRALDVFFGHGRWTHHAVRGVNLGVERGQSFGLVGESGSGKTTVLRAVAGLLGGVARLDGEMAVAGEAQSGQRRSREFRRRVQMVFQDPYGSLHPRHTVDTILAEPARVHRLDRLEERVVHALDEVGLDASFRFRYPHQLSGGQRQRVSIARALITGPEVVLLDEPTSALDVSVQAEVLNLLMRLRREHGLTYLLVSHNLAVVAHMCEALAVMQNGQIVEALEARQLREQTPAMPYTRQLLTASLGYDRGAIDAFEDFG
jgi:peptide/nickel transport system ATP-binding protein